MKMTLKEFFENNRKVALAFSGGVDSAYLLYAAVHYGAQVKAYYVKTAFQPAFELEDAGRLVDFLNARPNDDSGDLPFVSHNGLSKTTQGSNSGLFPPGQKFDFAGIQPSSIEMEVLPVDILSQKEIADNPADRCYFCKKTLFSAICQAAARDGYPVLMDGTNASDEAGDRPGMRAIAELSVLSPLRLCGLTKPEIRRLSREAGLFTWNKPAYACLATRVPCGVPVTEEILMATERSEAFLSSLGFRDFRVRYLNGAAKIQLPADQMEKALACRTQILDALKNDYSAVLLDLEAR